MPSNHGNKVVFVYLLVSIFHLVTRGLALDSAANISKGFLMPVLGLWLALNHRLFPAPLARALGGALFFSWLGDVLLINKVFFIYGLSAFLMAHLLYIYCFWTHPDRRVAAIWSPARLLALGLCIYSGWTMVTLLPATGAMAAPVVLYGLVLITMALSATLQRQSAQLTNQAFAGALLFVISDSLIAWNRFGAEIPLAGLWIMITYLPAQYLLVTGLRSNHRHS